MSTWPALIAGIPRGHWKTLTFLAGLRHDRIVAPFVLDGPINATAFTAWVEQCLAPTLNRGDIVILDNLGSHKGKPARNAIRNAGAHLFFLPRYSPYLKPIEMMSPNSRLCCARQTSVASKRHGGASVKSSRHSARSNAPPTSSMQYMFQHKPDRL
ncbi:transposase [Rhizobium sp. BK049]|uniref:transposase n=1 Tax=Rhizobium TaxID=379 RepID=UPI0017D45BEB|nr:transposase [Rhizobium lentis]MBB3356063.1 transposase [Rhizobium sp. BK049]